MMGDGQLDVAKGVGIAAADVLLVNVVDALAVQPVADLEVADAHGTGSLGDGDGVPNVIAMSMRNQDEIRRDSLRIDISWHGWIAGNKRIDQDALPVDLTRKRGMPQPPDFERHLILPVE